MNYAVRLRYLQAANVNNGRSPSGSAEGVTSMVLTGTGDQGVTVMTYIIDAPSPDAAAAEALRRARLFARHMDITAQPEEVTVEKLKEQAV
jgi:hypothetical protein